LRWALLGFAIGAENARAQLAASASLVSDYRYRGISLSRGDPALQASAAYDDASGLYGGVFASNVEFAISPHRELQGLVYGGYARRLAPDLSAELGASYAAFTGPGSYDYAEAYAGIAAEPLSARLYYAPRYFGRDSGAWYAELNAAQQLADRVRLLAHVGVLINPGGDSTYGSAERHVVDGRAGIAIALGPFTFQLSWVGVSSTHAGYPTAQGERRNTAVATLSRTF
jgi:uncharacterized protein (TIGR02001 family)